MVPARTLRAEFNCLFMLSGDTALRDDEIGMTRSNPNWLHSG
jgi:hypothetical protein